ncbi:MAG: NO-inducible flavohemoprotein [Flavobacterium psychrophilum]|nr:MAG: NO-inducible flavohemoprotein [Flavobacterium psychrophilum]
MNSRQKELVTATVPTLQAAGRILTAHFYKRMLNRHPELKETFNMGNQANGRQNEALAGAVLAYAEHIENPSVLIDVLKGIGNKHVSLNIQPEQYAIVGENLVASIGEVLGEAATPELLDAWTVAYNELAAIMSGLEKEMYKANDEKLGAWNGWRQFTIKEIVEESTEIKSFYLYPSDGKPIADYQPGQYISVQVFVEELGLKQPRQYSLSGAHNPEYYRISVKREQGIQGSPVGMVSNTLHKKQAGDTVMLSAPAGIFSLKESGTPIVLISGGIGVTPMLSMLETNKNNAQAKTVWVHGYRNASVHAFRDVVDTIEKESEWLETYLFNEAPEEGHTDKVIKGRVDLNHCKDAILLENAHYYICGPEMFIKAHYQSLIDMNVSKQNIFYEEFGPQSIRLN